MVTFSGLTEKCISNIRSIFQIVKKFQFTTERFGGGAVSANAEDVLITSTFQWSNAMHSAQLQKPSLTSPAWPNHQNCDGGKREQKMKDSENCYSKAYAIE